MINIKRTNSDNHDFRELVKLLDTDLAIRDGDAHAFYDQFNKIDNIRYVVVVYENEEPAGCGAIKEYKPGLMEVKRMFVLPGSRKRGIASRILTELEIWASELSFSKCILETGKGQPEAIELYKKNGYTVIPNYAQYIGVDNSLCFEKKL
jgi:putative acetyltransferase